MGYRVIYTEENGKAGRRSRVPMLTGLCFLLFLVLAACFWPHGWALIQEQSSVTVAALEELAGQLRTGNPLLLSLQEAWERVSYAFR